LIKILGKDFALDLENLPLTDNQEAAFHNEILGFKTTLNDLFISLRRAARSLRSRHPATDEKHEQSAMSVSPSRQ